MERASNRSSDLTRYHLWLLCVSHLAGDFYAMFCAPMLPELRDRFGFTRKYAIPILEETDRIGLTRREGDVRVKGDSYGR